MVRLYDNQAQLLVLLLAGCAETTAPVDPDACVPDPEPPHYGCNDLTGDAVADSLLPLPADSVP